MSELILLYKWNWVKLKIVENVLTNGNADGSSF